MKLKMSFLSLILCFITSCSLLPTAESPDPFQYLEGVNDKKAMEWVENKNKTTLALLKADLRYTKIKKYMKRVMDSKDKLIYVSFHGDYAYNLWRDKKHVRGLWRRASIKSYLQGRPKWNSLLDIDQLAKKEKKNWVFKGGDVFQKRALVHLSDGGKDATTVREFDLKSRSFLKGGFYLPEGKHHVSWLSKDELLVGEGSEKKYLTTSGYPMRVQMWKRGESLKSAPVIFKGDKKDVAVWAYAIRDQEDGPVKFILIKKNMDFYNGKRFIYKSNKLKPVNGPSDADFYFESGSLFMRLKSKLKHQGKTYVAGSLIRFDESEYLADSSKAKAELVFAPSKRIFIKSFAIINKHIVLSLNKEVSNEVVRVVKNKSGQWVQKRVNLPKNSTVYMLNDSKKNGFISLLISNYLLPKTLYNLNLKTGRVARLQQEPKWFNSAPYKVTQHFAVSKDGTRIPYFMVNKKSAELNGKNPTIMYGYGGFAASMSPMYSAAIGYSWLAKGGTWVLANIRGGGEYGPQWHQAALKENRQKAYDDFKAVAEDLIKRKVTSPRRLGVVGGSNGGLLTGVALTQYPELFNAAAIQVPLLDMLRYHKLLAGASWIGEYGDPENSKMRKVLKSYSPYHNVKANQKYPKAFFMTSTADDRVHPGHARKMAAKMESMGHSFYYYENTEGGHGGSSNNEQRANWTALEYTYFLQMLKD